jgi:hypothetical protein
MDGLLGGEGMGWGWGGAWVSLGVCITASPGTGLATFNYTASISGRCLDESTLLFWSRSQSSG